MWSVWQTWEAELPPERVLFRVRVSGRPRLGESVQRLPLC